MKNTRSLTRIFLIFLITSLSFAPLQAQMITGVWKGKIDKKKVELKIIQKGDSLTGTAYYYESPTNYKRYTIRGYFDQQTNNAVWWDDKLVEDRSKRSILSPASIAYLSSAEFNCPGSDEMYLDGKASSTERPNVELGTVDLKKTEFPLFPDEWDFVIDNYTAGGNDPYIIDSIATIAISRRVTSIETTPEKVFAPISDKVTVAPPPTPPPGVEMITTRKPTIEEKFIAREKVLTKEIVLSGDSVTLHFYDNAEIDGDSISLFLNDKLLFQHIRLSANAYTIKLPVQDLLESNELIMVAENLGEIPPNTSYMIAMVGTQRYDAQLASSENSSAMIRLVKKKGQ